MTFAAGQIYAWKHDFPLGSLTILVLDDKRCMILVDEFNVNYMRHTAGQVTEYDDVDHLERSFERIA